MFNIYVDENIKLRLLTIQDSNALFTLIDQNRTYLKEWLPWVDQIVTPYQFHTIIPNWQKLFLDKDEFHIGIFFKEKIVGMISLQQVDWANRQGSIGYYLAADTQKKGIMLKSVSAMLNYAFCFLKLNRVEIRCGLKNTKSQAIPKRLSFTQEGIIRDGELLYDHYHDLILYSMLAREWITKC